MNKQQLLKILKVAMIATFIMLIFEAIFSLNVVTDFFGNLIKNSNGVIVYLIIWVIMFLQVTILNIPAYVILVASESIGLFTLGWQYLLTVISAYMAGCILAYWLGRWFGVRAVRWCAGSQDDFDKWSNVLNKKGKIWYFLTVLFPLFPDDLLCLVAGAVKFDFGFYTVANLVGRSIGLITMLLVLKLIGSIGGGFPFMIIVWAVALILE
ncbi:MAG: TVP38/TMEM64 family protein, partial [Clostridiales bacterium]|nr:TVP38/TMEM64 family protein [Candidatus Apopatousia equi]